jgi:hypothetical protein
VAALSRALPYVLVVVAAWAGGWYFARDAADQAYTNLLTSCERVNATVRTPLYAFATTIVNEDELPGDVVRAAELLRTLTEPVECPVVVDKP